MGVFCNGKYTGNARLDGKTVIITGCNTGIGKHTAGDLYSRGGRVIMACRNAEKAQEAANDIKAKYEKQQANKGELIIKSLDLSSLSSVRKCANEILEEEPHIHILINNAGIMMCPKELTEDGYELQFATNHLGHFLFTLLLLPQILKSTPARIVNVSSYMHHFGDLSLDDINLDESYTPTKAYSRSKLANVLFSNELAHRLEGTGVTVYSLHPGAVDTDLQRHVDGNLFPGANCLMKMGKLFFKTPEDGAQTTLHCALDEKAGQETGLYYNDCKVTKISSKAADMESAKRLWDKSVEMVKLGEYDPFTKA